MNGLPRRRGRPPKVREATALSSDFIANVITDISREFHDDDQVLKSNITQAHHLWHHSGMTESDFVHHVLYIARARTKQQGNIKKPASEGGGLKNRMPYFWAVVKDTAGLKPPAGEQSVGSQHGRGAAP